MKLSFLVFTKIAKLNTDSSLTQTLLFGNTSFNSNKNLKILIATIDYILSTKTFEEPLF